MPTRTWSIEIICDHDDNSKDDLMKEMVRVHAKQLLTQALLLQDKRPPQIAVQSGDHFEASTEIMLVDDLPEDVSQEDAKPAEGAHSPNAERARVAGYTVSDKGAGWVFNDPDGKWSAKAYATEAEAWEQAFIAADYTRNPPR